MPGLFRCLLCGQDLRHPLGVVELYCHACDVSLRDIRSPDCPRCGEPPAIAISAQQALCGNDACQVFCWSMLDDPETFEALAVTIDLGISGGEGP
jgi:hypothetical protein